MDIKEASKIKEVKKKDSGEESNVKVYAVKLEEELDEEIKIRTKGLSLKCIEKARNRLPGMSPKLICCYTLRWEEEVDNDVEKRNV